MATSILSGVSSAAAAATTSGASGSASSASTTSGSGSSSGLGINGQSIAGNFQTFLTLLTTQLQNQDPTSPMDTNSFTQELVEFAQVEQQLDANNESGRWCRCSSRRRAIKPSALSGIPSP